MPAQVIQTNNSPFADVSVDAVTLDIIENALRNARTEMDSTTLVLPEHTGAVDQFGNILIQPNNA